MCGQRMVNNPPFRRILTFIYSRQEALTLIQEPFYSHIRFLGPPCAFRDTLAVKHNLG